MNRKSKIKKDYPDLIDIMTKNKGAARRTKDIKHLDLKRKQRHG